MFQFTLNSILIALASLSQGTQIFLVSGIKPNLVLVLMIVISVFNKSWLNRGLWILLAASLLKLGPGIDVQVLLFSAAVIVGMVLTDLLPSVPKISSLAAIIAGTLLMNIINFNSSIFLLELLYNLIIGAIVFVLYEKGLYKSQNKLR